MIKSLYETFQHWAAHGSIYILSDTHFCDFDCKLMDKDWIEPKEQIALINKKVHKTDTLILLGDVGSVECARKLNGYKVLIMGNHDQSRTKFEGIFDEIYEGPLMISEKILLSHEPVYGLKWCFNIHGHDHNRANKGDDYHLNLAANVCGYNPISLGDLIKQGLISHIETIHRIIIDNATERRKNKNDY